MAHHGEATSSDLLCTFQGVGKDAHNADTHHMLYSESDIRLGANERLIGQVQSKRRSAGTPQGARVLAQQGLYSFGWCIIQ